MPDPRFFTTGSPLTAAEASAVAGAGLTGDGGVYIRRAAPLGEDALDDAVVFACTSKEIAVLGAREAGLLLTTETLAATAPGKAIGVLRDPRFGFARIAARLHEERPIAATVGVARSARIGEGAEIHATAIVSDGAVIGERSRIGAHTVIGPGVVLGPDSVIGDGVKIACALIGARLTAAAGVRIGQPGFGFAQAPDGLLRVPQLGRVIIGADVEIGANSTIDRGALGDTVLGDGVKIDNLVQIGHNVRIGRHTVLAAQSGVAGSTVIGDGVMLGGQVGIADHLVIGDGARIAGGAGLMHNVPAGEKWGGLPGRPARKWLRETAMLARLTEKKKRGRDED